LASAQEVEKAADVVCFGVTAIEDYVIELPKTVKILAIPDDMAVTNDLASYSSSYQVKNNVLTVKRKFEDHTKGNVCSPQIMAEFKQIADKARDNLEEPVLYK
jgi:hypothetical protein